MFPRFALTALEAALGLSSEVDSVGDAGFRANVAFDTFAGGEQPSRKFAKLAAAMRVRVRVRQFGMGFGSVNQRLQEGGKAAISNKRL